MKDTDTPEIDTADARVAAAAAAPRELKLGGLCELVGLHLRMAQATVHRMFAQDLAPLDLNQRQIAVLWLIKFNPGVSQIDLATRLEMDRASMMAVVDKLDAMGLLDRQRSTIDRRRQELELTHAGRDMLARAQALVEVHEAKLRARIGAAELEGFVAALRRVRGMLPPPTEDDDDDHDNDDD
jgi:DNA-binding MarR family transcriptional regulator